MRTVRSTGFALLCVIVIAVIVVPAARAQRKAAPDVRPRAARSLAQEKINARVLSAIYHRRGDAKGKMVPGTGAGIQVDRHGRALVDVRAEVRPELEKKMKALGGIVVSLQHLRFHRRLDAPADARAARRGSDRPRYRTGAIATIAHDLSGFGG